MKLAVITDPCTHPEFDTTVELYRRFASDSRIELTHVSQKSVLQEQCHGKLVSHALTYPEFIALDDEDLQAVALQDFDLVFCRSDKPLPDEYYLRLAAVEKSVLFVNRPSALKEVSKRGFLETFAKEFLPDFVSTVSVDEAALFLEKHKRIVLKTADSYGGKGIWQAHRGTDGVIVEHSAGKKEVFQDSRQACESILAQTDAPLQLVRFLKNVGEGDKRVLVVGEKILGGYIRKSVSGSWINNITAGGKAELGTVTEKEKMIIERTCGEYAKRGVHTLGYDFLMDDDGQWILSEVNAGNIGGYNRLEALTKEPIIDDLITWLCDYAKNNQPSR